MDRKVKRIHEKTDMMTSEMIEEEMLIGPWVMGRDYSIADIYLFTISRWLEADGVDIRSFPRVIDHRQRMTELPVVSLVLAVEQQAH